MKDEKPQAKPQEIFGQFISVNLSPDAFHLWATHYYQCYENYQKPQRYSPVPYFLLCRVIELEIKAQLLKSLSRDEVKRDYGHNLVKAYHALQEDQRTLTDSEFIILEAANKIYKYKGFEYFNPEDALRGYSMVPKLTELDAVARKILGIPLEGAN